MKNKQSALEIKKAKKAKYDAEYYQDNKAKIKEYQQDNKEYIKAKRAKYLQDNKEDIKAQRAKYYQDNKEYFAAKQVEYQQDNKEDLKAQKAKYYQDNKEDIVARNVEYQANRKKTDPLYKLKQDIGSLIRRSIKNGGYSKKSRTYEILGCSYESLMNHIVSQFTEGMTIENHGSFWEIDHIFPTSWADTEDEVLLFNKYFNFQPLTVEDNREKRDNYAGSPNNVIATKEEFINFKSN